MRRREEHTTDWTFGGTWPYAPQYYETADGRLHYVDVGDREALPVVMLHGNPTWSYLFRVCIERLSAAGYRAIAIDHLGFGRSDIPQAPELYTVERHTQRLGALLDHLALSPSVFVLHDWAGPIALPYLTERAEPISGLMLLNTFAPRLPGPMGSRASLRALRGRLLGPFLIRRRNLPVEQFLFKAGRGKPAEWDERAKQAYRAPHPTPESRLPMLVFPREIPFAEDDAVARASRRYAADLGRLLTGKPVRILWGTQDVLFGEAVLERWEQLLPAAKVARIQSAGHFIPEDEPERVASDLVALADEVAAPRRQSQQPVA